MQWRQTRLVTLHALDISTHEHLECDAVPWAKLLMKKHEKPGTFLLPHAPLLLLWHRRIFIEDHPYGMQHHRPLGITTLSAEYFSIAQYDMKTLVVASKNPVKARATLYGFHRMFPGEEFVVKTVTVASGVSSQPLSSDETLQGARNRAQRAAQLVQAADDWIGIEGGVEEEHGDMAAFAWVVVLSQHLMGKSRTGTFFLPEAVARLVRQGQELGAADDMVFNTSNSQQAQGAIGLLTENVIDRTQLYAQAVILALVPCKNAALYTVSENPPNVAGDETAI